MAYFSKYMFKVKNFKNVQRSEWNCDKLFSPQMLACRCALSIQLDIVLILSDIDIVCDKSYLLMIPKRCWHNKLVFFFWNSKSFTTRLPLFFSRFLFSRKLSKRSYKVITYFVSTAKIDNTTNILDCYFLAY